MRKSFEYMYLMSYMDDVWYQTDYNSLRSTCCSWKNFNATNCKEYAE